MASPEYPLQPPQFFAPDSGTGGDVGDLPSAGQSEASSYHSELPSVQGIDFGDRSSWDHVVNIVQELELYDAREYATRVLGLPSDTSWPQIEAYIDAQDHIYLARAYGLPEDAPRELIDERLNQEEEERWQARVKALGLPEDATGQEIDDAERAIRAKRLGLAETTPWGDIWRAEEESRLGSVLAALNIPEGIRWDWEDLLRSALCIPGATTAEDYVRQILSIRAWCIEHLVREAESLARGNSKESGTSAE